jgi:NhaP-type Na+/H+ and K+/H+ antiporter
MFVARPASVFLSLPFARLHWREKVFVFRVGLRGSVPIAPTTFPLLPGATGSEAIFSIIFFIVLASALTPRLVDSRLMKLPFDSLTAPVNRDEKLPSGGTVLKGGDMVLVLVNDKNHSEVREIFMRWKKLQGEF